MVRLRARAGIDDAGLDLLRRAGCCTFRGYERNVLLRFLPGPTRLPSQQRLSYTGAWTSIGGTINPYYRLTERVIDVRDPADHDIGNVARHPGARPAPPTSFPIRRSSRVGSSVELSLGKRSHPSTEASPPRRANQRRASNYTPRRCQSGFARGRRGGSF